MRRINYLSEKVEAMPEAFRAGTSAKVAEKMYGILSRKTGKSFIPSSYPAEFANKEGKFVGYYATMGNTLVRINFLLSSSDHVHSVDVFGKNPRKPDATLHLMGSNIVQVIGQIADYFTGEFFRYEENSSVLRKPLHEAIKHTELLYKWINEEGNSRLLKDVEDGRVNIETEHQRFFDFCEANGRKGPGSASAFLFLMKRYVREQGLNFKIPSIEVVSGQTEEPINTVPADQTAFNEVVENEHLLKFRVLEFYMNQVARGDEQFRGVYVFGNGGIGKSHLAKKILVPLSDTFYMTGKVKGYTGLLSLLYKHREGEILVLDDVVTKDDMKSSAMENILKAVLDPEPPRRVQLQVNESGSSYFSKKDGVFYLSESDMKEYLRETKRLNEEDTEVVDMTSSEGMETPTDFHFESSIVFLTNYPKVPQALEDRCWALEMVFSNEQVMDIIETFVEKIAPNNIPEASELFNMMGIVEYNREDKKKVIEFMKTRDISGLVKRDYSIRVYKRLLALYVATKHTPLWEHFLAIELKS